MLQVLPLQLHWQLASTLLINCQFEMVMKRIRFGDREHSKKLLLTIIFGEKPECRNDKVH
jgi:hypothetical protein